MTLAERIARSIMLRLGFRDPVNHSRWGQMIEEAQSCISREIGTMKRVACAELHIRAASHDLPAPPENLRMPDMPRIVTLTEFDSVRSFRPAANEKIEKVTLTSDNYVLIEVTELRTSLTTNTERAS